MEDFRSQSTTALIETVARQGYMQIAELIDNKRFEEAGQVVEILKGVGIV